MRYSVLLEPVEESENMAEFYYAHVRSLGVTTHGDGVEGALTGVLDLIHLWVEEQRTSGRTPVPARESVPVTVEAD